MLEKYNEIWDKDSNAIKKGFNSKSVYNENYLRTKIKSYQGKIIFMEITLQKKVLSVFVYQQY